MNGRNANIPIKLNPLWNSISEYKGFPYPITIFTNQSRGCSTINANTVVVRLNKTWAAATRFFSDVPPIAPMVAV